MKLSGLAPPVTFPPKHLIRTQNLNIEVADMGKAVKPVLCHMTGGNQYWMFRTDGKILRDFLCIGRQVAHDFFPPLTTYKRNLKTNNIDHTNSAMEPRKPYVLESI